MIYITGDIHGNVRRIHSFSVKFHLTAEDTIIILGDVGANYFKDERDLAAKARLNHIGVPILCIHGNHEIRPANLPEYKMKEWRGGQVWFEEHYPNLLFAKDGEIFELENKRFLVIGGAYSVDKHYRLSRGSGWWEDEQPSEAVKAYVEAQIQKHTFDYILSHTCPFKYEPVEVFLPQVDQSTVDDSTEHWLDTVEEAVDYQGWYCGHWHTNKRIDKMHFLYKTWESIET